MRTGKNSARRLSRLGAPRNHKNQTEVPARFEGFTQLGRWAALGGLLGLAVTTSACDQSKSPAAATEAKPAAPKTTPSAKAEAKPPTAQPAAAPHGNTAGDLGIEWTDPAAWKRVRPTSPMRKASYQIPGPDDDKGAAELSVFYFGPEQGGSVTANLDRWVGQFSDIKADDVKRSQREANSLAQHVVEVPKGTYTNTMAMGAQSGPQKEHALLGAVVEAPSGKYFFKMTGPAQTVAAAKEDFFKMLDSMKAKGK